MNAIRNVIYSIRSLFYGITAPIRFLARWTVGLTGAPRRLLGLSLPARVAWLLAIFLILLTITAYTGFFLSNDRTHWYEWTRFQRMGVILMLIVATPLAVYKTLKLWLEGDPSRYPEIDRAWEEGIAELEANGIDLSETPIFLVLGSPDEQLPTAITQATEFKMVIEGVPVGRAPLKWYVDDQAVYLFTSQLGCLGRLNQLAVSDASSDPAAALRGTLVAGSSAPDPGPNIGGTIVAGNHSADRPATSTAVPGDVGGTGAGSPVVGATASPGQLQSTMVAGEAPAARSQRAQGRGGGRPLTRSELDDEVERLAYVCDRLRKIRQPLCPINGILTLLPLATFDDLMSARGLADAIQQDLVTVRRTTQLRCPVVALVTGMEHEPGFAELVRRVGSKRARESRFGKGFAIWQKATGENMDALSTHVVGAFEDWVYTLFRETDGLNKAGNGKLFAMLCKIRSYLGQRIRQALLKGFADDMPERHREERSDGSLFGGLYLAATGMTSDSQAFVRSVMQRLLQEEEELEWTAQAAEADRRYQLLADLTMVFNGILVCALAGAMIYTIWNR